MLKLYEEFGLDENTQSFTGHAMALQRDDSYLRRCHETLRALFGFFPLKHFGRRSRTAYGI